jgi:hypothetical protein
MLVSLAGLSASCARVRFGRPPLFLAFSLREAQRRYETGSPDGHVAMLSGITRNAGVVHDPHSADFIIAGLTQPGADRVALEDLVAAFRAVLRVREYPLVSIDRTAATATTGKQTVRVEGVRHDSPFASHLIAADVFLKRAALELPPTQKTPIPSYFHMCIESPKTGGREGHTALP